MNLEDKIWLATVLDCEGSIGLGKNTHHDFRKKTGKIVDTVVYSPHLFVTNSYLPLLERCKSLLGSPEMIRSRGPRLGSKPCYQVFLRNKKRILEILTEIEPYLMEKRELALRIIDWIKWADQRNRWAKAGCVWKRRRETSEEYRRRSLWVRELMPQVKEN